MSRTSVERWLPPVALVAAASLACGPLLLGRGFALVGDMSFVPDQPWKPGWLALDGSAPRAVPADALVSVLSQVVPGDLLQKAVLLGTLVAAGWGMYRMVARLGVTAIGARLAAALLYLWNPYVFERLAIGHWGLLVGYAALPWVAVAAIAVRSGEAASRARLLLALAPAALCSPTGGLLAGAVALVLAAGGPGWRRTGSTLVTVLVLNLPWLVPGVLGASTGNDTTGVQAFAARSDTPLGVWGSLLTLGGIWKASIVPGERDAWLLVLLALAVSASALLWLVRSRRTGAPEESGVASDRRRLLVLALAGLLVGGFPATGAGADVLATLVQHVPGAGLLRDSQKWAALLALAVAAGFGLVAESVAGWVGDHALPVAPFRTGLALLPIVLLPSFAWGLAGDLDPVQYPTEWSQVRKVIEDQPADQRRTVVLPFSAYQRFGWNHDHAALDPAIRYFPGQVVTNDQLRISDRVAVAGDSAAAARIGEALDAGEPVEPVLAATGVRYVLVERDAAGSAGLPSLPGRILYDGPRFRLLDTGNRAVLDRAEHPRRIVLGDVIALAALVGSGAFLVLRRFHAENGHHGLTWPVGKQ